MQKGWRVLLILLLVFAMGAYSLLGLLDVPVAYAQSGNCSYLTTGFTGGDEWETTGFVGGDEWGTVGYACGAAYPTIVTLPATLVEETSATMNGNITNVGAGNCTEYGFVWSTSSQALPGNGTAPDAAGYSSYWISGTSDYGLGYEFNYSGATLLEGTCYYFRAAGNNSEGWSYGDELYFLTKPDEPNTCVSVGNQTDSEISYTWVNGDGFGNTTWRYSDTGYPANITDGTLAYEGDGATDSVSGLDPGTKYYFAGWSTVVAVCGNATSDAACQFFEYTLPSDPSNLAVTPSCWDNSLEWTTGTGGNTTVVIAKENSCPANVGDGTEIYNGSGNTTGHSGLDSCSEWCYSIWNYDADSGYYSSGYDEAWGNTTSPGVPSVTTDAATSVEETQAQFNGNVTTATCNVDIRGFVWGTSTQGEPGNATAPAASGYDTYWTEVGNFTTEAYDYTTALGNLTEGTCYYFRAVAHSCDGYKYGGELTLLTKPEAPSALTVTAKDEGSISLSWTKGAGAGNTTIRYDTAGYPATYAAGSSGYEDIGLSCTISGLTEGTKYYIRAWSNVSACGETKYSDGYDELTDCTLPGNVTNFDAFNPTSGSIDLEWTKGGNADYTVVRGKQGGYPANITDGIEVYNDTGNSTTHGGLGCCEDWYYRAWALDTDCGYYSSGYDEDTESTDCTVTTVVTNEATLVEEATATVNGNITAVGGCDVTEYAFVWGLTAQVAPAGAPPGLYDDSWTSGTGNYTAGAYNHNLTGLNKGTCYYFRFGANSTVGWAWGDEDTLVTKPDPPSGCAVDSYTSTSITFSWTNAFTPGSIGNTTSFRYGTTCPTSPTDGTSAYNGNGTSTTVNGLTPGTEYCFVGYGNTTACGETKYSDGNCTFTQYTLSGNITNISSTPSCWGIGLEWTKGEGAEKTMVRVSDVDYPATVADGIEVYFDTGNTTSYASTPCTTLYFSLWSYDNDSGEYDGRTTYSDTTTVPALPTAITLAATLVEEQSATLNGNITDAGGCTFDYYGFVWDTATQGDPGNVTPALAGYTDSWTSGVGNWTEQEVSHATGAGNLTQGTCYYIRVAAHNCSGWAYGDELTLLTKPEAPTACVLSTIGNESLSWTWTKGAGSQDTVFRYDTSITCPGNYTEGADAYSGNETSATLNGLTPGSGYCIRGWGNVTACGETKYSDSYCEIIDYTLPGNPTNLDAHNPTAGSIDLEWTVGAGGNETVVIAKQGSYPGNITDGAEIYRDGGNTTTHSGLNCCENWYYRAWSYDGESGYYSASYAQDTETTDCTPSTVETLAATLVEETTADLNGNITATGGCDVNKYAFVWGTTSQIAPVADPPGLYDSSWTSVDGNYTVEQIHSITTLNNGTCYYFRFGALTGDAGWSWGDELTLTTKPIEPNTCTATGYDSTSISWSWNKGSGAGNTTFRYAKISTGCPATYLDGSNGYYGEGTSTSKAGLDPGTGYCFRGWSISSECGASIFSDAYCEIQQYTLPGNVTYLVADNGNCTTVDLSWIVGDGADFTIVYGKQGSAPTFIGDGVEIYNGAGNSAQHTGLSPCQHWYYSAWAYDSESGYYSDGYDSDDEATISPTIPTVTTQAASVVEETTATLNATITDTGGCLDDYRGFVWGNTSQADPGNVTPAASGYDLNWTENGNWTAAAYTHDITALTKGEAYYYRGTAHDCNGWGYGPEQIFLTKPNAPTGMIVTAGIGNNSLTWVMGNGSDNTYIYRGDGVCPANRTDPLGVLVYSGTGTAYDDVGLTNGHNYCYRAWGYAAEAALEQYSDDYDEGNGTPNDVPTVTTNPATLVEETTATLNGNATSLLSILERGFNWGTTTGVYVGNWTESDAFGNGSFSTGIASLSEGDCIYFQAKARNAMGWGNGSELVLLTKPLEPTALLIYESTDTRIEFTWTKGTGAGNTTIRYDTAGYPATYTDGSDGYFGTASAGNVTGLAPGQHYFFRAWSQVSDCGLVQYSDAYDELEDYTKPSNPGNLTATGLCTQIDLEWTPGTGGNTSVVVGKQGDFPLDPGEGTVIYNGTGNTTSHTGLAPCSAEWNYRVWNYDAESGYYSDGYAQDSAETTDPALPTVSTLAATVVEETTATLNGNVTNAGGCTFDYYAFVWDTSSRAGPGNVAPAASGYALTWTSAVGNMTEQTTTHDITDLGNGTCYYFRAAAHNCTGWTYGTELTLLTKPQAPTAPTVSGRTDSSISLTWTKGVGAGNTTVRYSDIAYPATYADGSNGYFGNGTTCTINFLSSCQIYYVRMWSQVSDCGEVKYSDGYAELTDYTLPTDVSNCTATAMSSTSIDLAWTPGCGGNTTIRGSTVGYPVSATDGVSVYEGTGNTTTHVMLGIHETWFYAFYSHDIVSGYWSATPCLTGNTTLFGLPAVTNSVGATMVTDVSARLNGEVTGTGGEDPTTRIYWGDHDGGTDSGSWDNVINHGVHGLGVFNSDIAGLTPSTPYFYRCYVVNSGGSAWAPSTETFNTLGLGPTPYRPVVVASTNVAVTCTSESLTGDITDVGNATVTIVAVAWDTVCRADPGNSTAPGASAWAQSWTQGGSYGNESYSHTIGTLSGNTTYFWVAAVFNGTYWGYSACGNFTTVACACAGPTNLTATRNGSYAIDLTWTPAYVGATTVIRMGIGSFPASATEGVDVYYGTGDTTTYYVNSDYIDDTLDFRAWTVCP